VFYVPLKRCEGGVKLALFSLAVAFAVARCGGGGEEGAPDGAAADENALAQSMLLALSDFPTGWAEESSDEDEESPFDQCDSEADGQTGRAETGEFSEGGNATVAESVVIFNTAARVSARLDNLLSFGDCLVGVVASGKLDTDEISYSDASFGRVSFPQLGDRTEAFRLGVRFKQKGQTGFGSEGELYVDVVNVIVGRVGLSIQATDALTPYESSEVELYVGKALAKVRQRLPQQ
jgi:hypothetical protein